jgi:small subunit ribosomal protein S5
MWSTPVRCALQGRRWAQGKQQSWRRTNTSSTTNTTAASSSSPIAPTKADFDRLLEISFTQNQVNKHLKIPAVVGGLQMEGPKPPTEEERVSGYIKDAQRISESSLTADDAQSMMNFITEDKELKLLEDPDHPMLNGENDFLINEVLAIGRHSNVTAGGRIASFSALVMLGTGSATAGLGRGRGETVNRAIEKATIKARKNMFSIERYRGCTISSDLALKFKRTKVVMKAGRMGYGIKASPEMRVVLEAFGLTDVMVCTIGRKTNKQALYRALFRGLQDGIHTPEGLSRALGRKFFDVHKTFYYKHE